jgi:heme/copper-type cytochrome/quinol oxidase subunit 2
MRFNRRSIGFVLLGAGACLLAAPAAARLFAAQDQTPNRREFTVTAKNYEFSPARIEVMKDDLVKITLRSNDEAHSFTIDGYRIMKRVPAGGSTTFEFRADKPGTFPFYCGMTNAEGHGRMKGELVVASR